MSQPQSSDPQAESAQGLSAPAQLSVDEPSEGRGSHSPALNKKKLVGRLLRLSLLVLGAVSLLTIVKTLGARSIYETIVSAGMYLPIILALDIGWFLVESRGARALYGDAFQRLPSGRFAYSILVHYVTFLVVPMGRASAEVARAALLGPHVGKQRAVVSAALMQSFSLICNALICVVSLVFVMQVAAKSALSVALLTTIAVNGAIGIAMYMVMRHVRLGGFLGRRFAKLQNAGPEFDEAFRSSKPAHLKALGYCMLARCVQATQYAVIVLAVSGHVGVGQALIAEGIQLVARSAGDMIPNQVGVTEGAFALFKGPLGFAQQASLAVSVALVARVSNLSMAGLSALLIQFWPNQKERVSSEIPLS